MTRARVVDLQPWLQEVLVGESEDEEALIHITEMLAIVALACRLGEKWVGKVIVYAGDNQVVRSWIEKRQSGSRVGRMLVRMLALCEMRYRFFVVAGWWRTYHNVDSDFITRCSDEEYEEVIAKRGWTAVRVDEDVVQAAIDSRRFGPCFLAWSDPEDRRVMMQLKERRLERMVDRPIRVAWENFAVHEWVPEGRTVKDFELVARSCGAKGTVLIVAGTFGCDVQGKHVRTFIDCAEERKAEVVVAEGPSQVQWEAIEEWCARKGWHTGRLEFISTEFGEAMARRRIAVIGMRDTITSEMAEMSVVRAVVGAPVASRMSATTEVKDLLWKNPARLTLAPGVPRNPLLPHVVAHMWWEENGPRINVHGMTGPMRWPLRSPEGHGFEESIVYDRCGPPGRVRKLTPLEVWWCQGRTTEDWRIALEECGSEDAAWSQGCRATGAQTAQTLLMAAAALYQGGSKGSEEKAGAVRDYQDESLAKLLLWLRRWKRRDFGEDRGPEDARAGGSKPCRVSRYAEAMWLDALEEVEKYVEMNLHAGGRSKRANAVEEHGNSLVGNGERMVLPFDGGVALRIDEWLEANMHGDKAESTSRAYQSSWQKWIAWARRQAWDSEYLDPKQPKLENENKLLAFLGYMGWLGSSPATMRQTLASIKDYHKRAGAGDPTEGMYRIWLLVNSLDRRTSKKPRRLGVTPGMLRWIGGQLCGGEQLRGEKRIDSVMLQAALLTAWYFMMRASEYCDSGGVKSDMVLRGVDVKLTKDGVAAEVGEANEITVQFRKTKADQEAFGSCKTMGATGQEFLCPVAAMEEYRKYVPGRFKGPEAERALFRWGNGVALKRIEVQSILQKAAVAEGLPADRFLSHSLRIGGASALFQVTADVELVKRMGRWTSSAVHRYLHDGGHVLKELSGKMARVNQRVHYT